MNAHTHLYKYIHTRVYKLRHKMRLEAVGNNPTICSRKPTQIMLPGPTQLGSQFQ